MFFNLTPQRVIPAMKRNGGTVREVFKVAKEMQPSIIYIDDVYYILLLLLMFLLLLFWLLLLLLFTLY
jgi:hypothetical protein